MSEQTTNTGREVPLPAHPESLEKWFGSFIELVRILRQDCPWDRKQTHESISHLLIEESYETLDAISAANDDEFSKELGDLLLHVVMHSVMAEQRGAFTMRNVIEKSFHKLVHRHPHVFGNGTAHNEDDVKQRWEELKLKEGRSSILGGVPKAMPALLRAQRMQEKAANIGFDWENRDGAWEKTEEEFRELQQEIIGGDLTKISEEFGDFLFALVNSARFAGIIAEDALQAANQKFTRRFQHIESEAAKANRPLKSMTLAEMDELWNDAKRLGM
ncbi:nucleoside triphosphate pyrophosphohydrolase [Ignavibacteria bacterium]|nr:nucleoside triphosphate pyrophosphohydrolase [Bacteroidota bacterium]MCZ2132790.1 nucleoside triphosphate pyrophosphohydrolase [Bacteroidota bacterium]